MEPKGSLLHSQVPTTCPPPESASSSPYPTSHFLKIYLNIILPSLPRSPKCFFPSGFPTETLYTPLLSSICTTCFTHLILLDFITQTILGEEYRSLSSSLCNFLHSLVTSSLVGPNILLNILFANALSLRFVVEFNIYFLLVHFTGAVFYSSHTHRWQNVATENKQ